MLLERIRWYEIHEEDKIITPGISWGYGQGSVLNLIRRGEFYQVWHKPTTQDWVGRMAGPDTFPATYYLVSICGDRVRKEIESAEPGRKWRSERDRLVRKCDRMNRLASLIAMSGG